MIPPKNTMILVMLLRIKVKPFKIVPPPLQQPQIIKIHSHQRLLLVLPFTFGGITITAVTTNNKMNANTGNNENGSVENGYVRSCGY